MKRKGFLKNIIGALCVGALISMPVTVSAAEKEDVVGKWTYNDWGGTVEFKSDGMAEDVWEDGSRDSAPYHMESGSITIYGQSLSYDFWRGLGDSPLTSNTATLYQIRGEGQMLATSIAIKK